MASTFLKKASIGQETLFCTSDRQIEKYLKEQNIDASPVVISDEEGVSVTTRLINKKMERVFPGVYRKK